MRTYPVVGLFRTSATLPLSWMRALIFIGGAPGEDLAKVAESPYQSTTIATGDQGRRPMRIATTTAVVMALIGRIGRGLRDLFASADLSGYWSDAPILRRLRRHNNLL